MAVRLLLVAIMAAITFGALALYVNSTQAGTLVEFTVNSSLDAGDALAGDGVCDTVAGPPVVCTLRAAIRESNALIGANDINFTATNTVVGAADLPIITERVTIDASANAAGFTINAAAAAADGLTLGVGSSGSVIRGLNITLAPRDGLAIIGGASHTIGGDPSEGAAPSGQGNAFNGSVGDGIEIRAGSQGGHFIIGNKIGTSPDGLTPLGNGGHGIHVSGGTGADITIGGFPNLISDNALDGVFLAAGTPDVTVQYNWIGLDANGNASDPFANIGVGIHIHTDDSTIMNNTVAGGGVVPADNPSAGPGIDINSDDNTVLGNCVGFDSDCAGTAGGFNGIGIACTGAAAPATADRNIIGDGTKEGRNVVGNTDAQGISLFDCDNADINGNYVGFGMDGEEGAVVNGNCIDLLGTAPLTGSDLNQVRNNTVGNCNLVGILVVLGGSNVIGGRKAAVDEDNDGNDIGRGTDPATSDDINGFCLELRGAGGNTVRNNVMANCGGTAPDASLQITAGAGNIIQGNDITSPVGEDAIDISAVAAGANSGNLIASRIFRMVNQGTGDLPLDLDDNGVTLNDAGDLDPDVLNATCLLATPLGANLCHNYPVFPPSSPTDGCARGTAGPFDEVRIYIKTVDGNVTTYEYMASGFANAPGDFTICIGNTSKVTVVGTSTVTAFSTTDILAINSTSEFSLTEQTVQAGATATSTAPPPPTNTPPPPPPDCEPPGSEASLGRYEEALGVSPVSPLAPAAPSLVGGADAPAVTIDFQGMGQGETCTAKPDTHAAVGPDRIVEVTNLNVAIYNKTGGLIAGADTGAGAVHLSTFCGSEACFDPKVIYDQYSQRFVAVAVQGTQFSESFLHIMVSKTSTPGNFTTDWDKFHHASGTTIDSTNGWMDYPGLGVSPDAVVVTGNIFPDAPGPTGTKIRVFDKAELYDGDTTATFVDIDWDNASGGFTIQPAHHFGSPPSGTFYLLQNWGESTLRVIALTGVPSSPTASSDLISTSGLVGCPAGAPQEGTTKLIQTLCGRMMNAVWRDGSLWGTLTDGSDSADRAVVQWFEIETNGYPSSSPTRRQHGTIDGGAGESTYMPSISVDACNNTALTYTQSSSSRFPEMRYTGRLATDTLDAMQKPVVAKASAFFFDNNGGLPSQDAEGWGDYSSTVIDPVDQSFWIAHEYARVAATSAGNDGGWGTWLANFTFGCTLAPTLTGDVNCDGVVNPIDALFILQFAAGLIGALPCQENADVNEDGTINTIDASLILQFVAGLIGTLPPSLQGQGQALSGSADIRISPLAMDVPDQGEVELELRNVTGPGLGAWTIDVEYDPAVVSVISCDSHPSGVCNPAFDVGTIRSVGASATGIEDDTTLASITFDCETQGTTALAISLIVFAEATVGDLQDVSEVNVLDGKIDCGSPVGALVDTDGDGCTDQKELGPDEMLGGLRDYLNPWDFYDVAGGGGGPPDAIIDLSNDIFGVIIHYAPTGTEPEYDANFDRGPSAGPNAWNMTAPDGVIDLSNDILGVIQQYSHSCR